MASISITIDDAHVNRVLDAFAAKYDYATAVAEEPTLTKTQFARRQVARYVRETVRAVETEAAIATAAAAVTNVTAS